MPSVPPPSAGLGSNSNYFLNNNGSNLDTVATAILVLRDIVPSAGIGFQLNAYSPNNEKCAAQQYVICDDTSGQMDCVVNNWDGSDNQLINTQVSLHKFPSPTLPDGCQCIIALHNDATGNVTGASFAVRLLSIGPQPGSGLDGYSTTNGYEHVNYIGADNHIHELIYTDQWANNDLSQLGDAPDAAPGSHLAAYQTANGNEHVAQPFPGVSFLSCSWLCLVPYSGVVRSLNRRTWVPLRWWNHDGACSI